MFVVAPIVEGHGEVRAVPLLLRRIAFEICGRAEIHVLPPHRIPRNRIVSEAGSDDLTRAVELAVRKIRNEDSDGAVMLLLDADDDCPAELGPALLARIARPDVKMSVVLAKREYEAWFLAAARSIVQHTGVDLDVAIPNAEAIRGAKEHFERHLMAPGANYRETVDQPRFTTWLDLTEARAAPSFDKLCRDLCGLMGAAGEQNDRAHPED